MYLVLDCSQKDSLCLKLISQQDERVFFHAGRQADLLKALHLFLTKEQCDLLDITGIAAVTGEGSFTSSRLAVLCANVFHFVKGIPVIAVTSTDELEFEQLTARFTRSTAGYVLATYTGAPNIR